MKLLDKLSKKPQYQTHAKITEFVFNNDKERAMYEEYKQLKGEEIHFYVAEHIQSNKYIEVAAAIQYDLRLKYILYRYVCFYEEWIRAILMNCNIKNVDFFLYKSVTLGDIQQLYFKNFKQIQEQKPDLKMISGNQFDSVRRLRNDVSHFKFLIFEMYDQSVRNIKTLQAVIPEHYMENLKKDINNCTSDWPLPPGLKITI
ncbi:hypothetical protein ELUMI_v1c07110 [Williamsoniiplasma luminosum]|uniref:Uncharacterized protein n=1 Tax=Williamsoniiplasma luminosum TaxID=214888 RepID=A0A2K8NXR5_9MOLU|nr:hypothetical protein [Williamsoniiplasma luminosum]ATZ17433.1 hypothetical protein ELUMI_v1c07110 [Williamsoniiplasma luminosum]